MQRLIFTNILLFILLGGLIAQNSNLEKQIAEKEAAAEAFLAEGKHNDAAQVFNQLAYLLRSSNRLEEAAVNYQKVLEINVSRGNRRGQMIAHNSLSMVYLEAENYPKAIYHLEKELEFRKQVNNKAEIINVLTNLAQAQNETSSYDSAIEDIEKAIDLSKELNDLGLLKQCYGVAYDIYEKQGNPDKSREYFELYSTLDRKLKEQKMAQISDEADRKVNIAQTEKQLTEQELSQTSEELEKTVTTLHEAEELTEEQRLELALREEIINETNARIEAEQQRNLFLRIGLLTLSLFVIALTIMILKIRRANKKINLQKLKLEKQNKEIKASIRYAQTIQQAMLPSDSQIEKYFDPFIIYLPKDIVSGDFYWITSQESKNKKTVYLAVVDCTGHGVPGAFMSMIGNRLLNEIVTERGIESPAEVLGMLNTMVKEALRQEETDNNDGMDLAFCKFEIEPGGKCLLTFSGAKRPVYIIKNSVNKLITYNGDRKSIGGYSLARKEIKFTNHTQELEQGDMIYLFSDGIIDQNGPERKKFGRLRLEEAMIDSAKLNPAEQKEIFEKRLNDYMNKEEQRDDIALLGIKVI